jgi:acetaldehyde dehydrogenase/alcohol dehydrogenase
MPTKLVAYPKYEFPEADRRYFELARYLGLPAGSVTEGVESLVRAVVTLRKELNMPATLEEAGVKAEEFESFVKELAYEAFADQTTASNPRLPLVKELEAIYRLAYNRNPEEKARA